MILGLDLATKTGWCLLDDDGNVKLSGVEDFSKQRGESNGTLFLRFNGWIRNKLLKNLSKLPDLIAYEQAHHQGGAATEICVGLTTRVQEVAAEFEVTYATVHTTTLKKFATGSGKAGKDEMMKVAELKLGRKPIDDNEADATLIACWAKEEFGL